MSDTLKRGEWESVLHAPFHVYSVVARVDGEPDEAQFRRLGEEIVAGRAIFPDGSLGARIADALADNVDPLWAAYQASGRSPKDGLVRARKALKRTTDEESIAIRDWWISLGIRVAEVRRTLGTDAVSDNETGAISEIAGWLKRPVLPVG